MQNAQFKALHFYNKPVCDCVDGGVKYAIEWHKRNRAKRCAASQQLPKRGPVRILLSFMPLNAFSL
nr:MAG TPA: hypothetical protein [Caudoviricetes sp.]